MADADDVWLADQEALEKLTERVIQVDAQPRRWHGVLLTLRNHLIEAATRYKTAQRVVQRARRGGRAHDVERARWQWFLSHGTLLMPPNAAFPLRVTPGTYERARSTRSLCGSTAWWRSVARFAANRSCWPAARTATRVRPRAAGTPRNSAVARSF